MPLQATRESSAHRRVGLGEHEFGDPVGIVRDVQPGPGADLDDAAAGAAQQRTSPAAHACDLAEPEKRVIHQGENPQPRRRRGLAWSSVQAMSVMPRTYERPPVRASLDAAIFRRWPVPATSQQSETRGLGDGGRP